MGSGVEKCHPLAVQFPLLLYLSPKGLVSALQIREGCIQPLGQFVQAAAQFANLVPTLFPAFPMEIQLRHLPGNAAHAHDGPGDVPRVEERAQQGKGQQHQHQPGRHLRQRPHGQVFRPNPGCDIEGIALFPTGKAHLGGNGGLLRHGDGRGVLCRPNRRPVADHSVPFRRGDNYILLPVHSLNRQLCPSVHQPSVRPHQHGVGPGGEHELIQKLPTFCRRTIRQFLHQDIHLSGKIVIYYGGVGAGGGPGDKAESDGPGKEQNAGGNEKDAGGQALINPLWQHGSPPPLRSQCSPAPVCGGDS